MLVSVANEKSDFTDFCCAVRAVEDLVALFSKAPRAYAHDRGGYSPQKVERLGELGVRGIGLVPRGRAAWEVEGKVKERLIRERATVEGSIGAIKGALRK